MMSKLILLFLLSGAVVSEYAQRNFHLPEAKVNVRVNLVVRRIREVNSNDQTFSVQLIFRQSWRDTGLLYFNQSGNVKRAVELDEIWTPDTYFSNELEGNFHKMLRNNSFVRVDRDGLVLISQRITLKLDCPMNLHAFPFDRQECSIKMSSNRYSFSQLDFIWKEFQPIQIPSEIGLREFALTETQRGFCNSATITGESSCLKVTFFFKRLWKPYLIQVFLPMGMLISISWLSFWIKDSAVRVTILLFTLTMAVLGCGRLNSILPQDGHLKMIDYFNGGCIIFIVAAIVEFASVTRKRETCEEKVSQMEKQDVSWRLLYPIAFVSFLALFAFAALLV